MKINKLNHFKLTIEEADFKKVGDKFYIKRWRGYGLILLPFGEWVAINRGDRAGIFNWIKNGKVYQVDVVEYIVKNFIHAV